MKKSVVFAALVASFAVVTSAQATQYIQNGDFTELTNGVGLIGNGGKTKATGWTTTGYNIVESAATNTKTVRLWDAATSSNASNTWDGLSPTGGDYVALDGDYGTAAITQTITGLTVGDTYTLSFDYAFAQQQGYTGATIQSLAATLAGATVFQSANYDLASEGFSGWMTYTTTITATSTSEVLSFLATGNLPIPPFALLTDVSLVNSAVPEPATWAMMLVGLGTIGAAARRRRRQATVSA